MRRRELAPGVLGHIGQQSRRRRSTRADSRRLAPAPAGRRARSDRTGWRSAAADRPDQTPVGEHRRMDAAHQSRQPSRPVPGRSLPGLARPARGRRRVVAERPPGQARAFILDGDTSLAWAPSGGRARSVAARPPARRGPRRGCCELPHPVGEPGVPGRGEQRLRPPRVPAQGRGDAEHAGQEQGRAYDRVEHDHSRSRHVAGSRPTQLNHSDTAASVTAAVVVVPGPMPPFRSVRSILGRGGYGLADRHARPPPLHRPAPRRRGGGRTEISRISAGNDSAPAAPGERQVRHRQQRHRGHLQCQQGQVPPHLDRASAHVAAPLSVSGAGPTQSGSSRAPGAGAAAYLRPMTLPYATAAAFAILSAGLLAATADCPLIDPTAVNTVVWIRAAGVLSWHFEPALGGAARPGQPRRVPPAALGLDRWFARHRGAGPVTRQPFSAVVPRRAGGAGCGPRSSSP